MLVYFFFILYFYTIVIFFFFFSSRRRHTRCSRDWSSDVCSSDLNGRFRDDVRSFFRGEEGMVERIADRLIGSPSLYGHKQREPEQSVNFVTCHDGFTLNDLVSYDRKHNEANGE